MTTFHVLYGMLAGVATLLIFLAAFSRIATMPQSPQLIKNAGNALSHLFIGAFGQ